MQMRPMHAQPVPPGDFLSAYTAFEALSEPLQLKPENIKSLIDVDRRYRVLTLITNLRYSFGLLQALISRRHRKNRIFFQRTRKTINSDGNGARDVFYIFEFLFRMFGGPFRLRLFFAANTVRLFAFERANYSSIQRNQLSR